MKKLTAAILAVIMIICFSACEETEPESVPGSGTAVSGTIIANSEDKMFKYVKNGDRIEITEYIGNRTEVRVPEDINGVKVTKIGDNAFSDRATLKKVHIPSSVTEIGDKAFYRCFYLETVTGCEGLTAIGKYAFGYNKRLKDFPWENSLQVINECAFVWCDSLKEIKIVSSCDYIGDFAFRNCESAEELVFEDGQAVNIGKEAFMGLCSITSLCYPYISGITGEGVFKHANSLTDITFDSRVTSICNRAFQNSQGLTEVTIPKHIERVEDFAFGSCKSIKRAVFENPTVVLMKTENTDPYIFLQNPNVTIVGVAGSTAEKLAKKIKVKFEVLE